VHDDGFQFRRDALRTLAFTATSFSLDASVRIEAHNRVGLQRLLRYCARLAVALERPRAIDAEHLAHCSAKPGPGGSHTLRRAPLERLERHAVLIPPPRRFRHRYFGLLAPNAPQRRAVNVQGKGGAGPQ
jgi:hypothetical protein